jgi:hypothetical protein
MRTEQETLIVNQKQKFDMTDQLYKWLEERWKKDNHTKYHHLFSEWIANITEAQILGYSLQEQKRNIYN